MMPFCLDVDSFIDSRVLIIAASDASNAGEWPIRLGKFIQKNPRTLNPGLVSSIKYTDDLASLVSLLVGGFAGGGIAMTAPTCWA